MWVERRHSSGDLGPGIQIVPKALQPQNTASSPTALSSRGGGSRAEGTSWTHPWPLPVHPRWARCSDHRLRPPRPCAGLHDVFWTSEGTLKDRPEQQLRVLLGCSRGWVTTHEHSGEGAGGITQGVGSRGPHWPLSSVNLGLSPVPPLMAERPQHRTVVSGPQFPHL